MRVAAEDSPSSAALPRLSAQTPGRVRGARIRTPPIRFGMGMESERVHACAQFFIEQSIHLPVTGDQIASLEARRDHHYFEVRLRTRWHVVLVALVFHLEVNDFEAVAELSLHSFLDVHERGSRDAPAMAMIANCAFRYGGAESPD